MNRAERGINLKTANGAVLFIADSRIRRLITATTLNSELHIEINFSRNRSNHVLWV